MHELIMIINKIHYIDFFQIISLGYGKWHLHNAAATIWPHYFVLLRPKDAQCVWDSEKYTTSVLLSWFICICPYFCLRSWQLFCVGISQPPHPLYRLLAECRDRGVTINSTCFFLSALVIVGHMVMMWKGESG